MAITEILQTVKSNNPDARVQLIEAAHHELRRIAGKRMARERDNHTLSSTALVNEVSLRLLRDGNFPTESRGRFFAYVAKAMRNHLIDHARSKGRQIRGGNRERISFDETMTVSDEQNEDLLALNEVLEDLAEQESRQAQVVEMKYFGGLSNIEIAYALNVSIATVKRDWDTARTWLRAKLNET